MNALLTAGAYAGAIIAIGTVVSLIAKWFLLPRIREWIQREVGRPVAEIRAQVTPNGGNSNLLGDQVVILRRMMIDHLEHHDQLDKSEP